MPTIIAIFSDMKSLQDAQDALRSNGYDDAVLHVVDQSGGGAEGAAPVVAGPQQQGTIMSRATPDRVGFLDGLDLPDGEAEFVRDAVEDGARLIVLDADDAPGVNEVLRPHAQRIVPGR